jgi:adenylate kinase
MDQGGLLDDKTMSGLIMAELAARGWVKSASPSVPHHSLSDPLEFTFGTRRFSSTSVASAAQDVGLFSSSPKSWLLDGFPRTLSQAQSLETYLHSRDSGLNLVVNINVPPSTIFERISSRLIHPASGRVYNLSYNPPRVPGKDDVTGEPLVRRTDDDETIWRSRVERYEEEAGPLERWLEQKGLVWKVTGETSDEIYPKIEAEVLRRFGEHQEREEIENTVMGVGLEEQELGRLAVEVATIKAVF